MHARARSALVVAVVVVVVAAPAAGLAQGTAAGGGSPSGDAADRPAVDDRDAVEGGESSDWSVFEFDDHDEDDDDQEEEEGGDEDDRDGEDEREDEDEDEREDDDRDGDDDRGDEDEDADDDEREDREDEDEEAEDEDRDWDWDWDDDERENEGNDDEDESWWDWMSDDDDDDGDDRERGNRGNGNGNGNGEGNPGNGNDNPGNGNDDRGNDDRGSDGSDESEDGSQSSGSDDDSASNDAPESGDQQSEGASDDSSSDADQPDDRDGTDDTSEDQSVRVDAQEDDESQEGEDGERNATRNESVEPGPDVGSANVTVLQRPDVVGQQLVVEATTTNEGTEAGRKVVQFEVEHEIVDRRSFVLQPNETRTVTFTHVFETPGNKTFEVDTGLNRFVTVEERRPNLSVSTVEAAPESVEAGEDVTITAVVSNQGHANGSLPVALELFDEVVAVENVTLATGESAEVTFTRTVHAPGTYEATVENESAEFQVTGDPTNNASTAATNESVLESAAETPGFEPIAALAGVVVAIVLVLARRE